MAAIIKTVQLACEVPGPALQVTGVIAHGGQWDWIVRKMLFNLCFHILILEFPFVLLYIKLLICPTLNYKHLVVPNITNLCIGIDQPHCRVCTPWASGSVSSFRSCTA